MIPQEFQDAARRVQELCLWMWLKKEMPDERPILGETNCSQRGV